jgi:hypothetical protein
MVYVYVCVLHGNRPLKWCVVQCARHWQKHAPACVCACTAYHCLTTAVMHAL